MLSLTIAVAAEMGVAARLAAGAWRRYPFFALAIVAGLAQHVAALCLSPGSYRALWIATTPLLMLAQLAVAGELFRLWSGLWPRVDQALDAWLASSAGTTPPGKDYDLPPHRQELVEKFLAWWEGDRSEIGLAVKAAVSKLAGVPWIQPELDAQKRKR